MYNHAYKVDLKKDLEIMAFDALTINTATSIDIQNHEITLTYF